MSNPSPYRVLTVKEQADLIAKLERANALLAEAHALVLGDVPQKVRKPRRKAEKAPAAPAEATPKKRGRPAKTPAPAAEPEGEL